MQVPPSTSHRVLVALTLIAVALTAWIIYPFWIALFLAAVLAGLLRRPMEWLAHVFRGRRSPAAFLLTLAVLFAVLLPLTALGALIAGELVQGVQWARDVLANEGLNGFMSRLPGPLERLAHQVASSLPNLQGQLEKLATAGGKAAAAAGGVVTATTSVLFQGAMMLIALFFFLVSGQQLVAWLDDHVPLKPGQLTGLITEFRRTSSSVLVASFATALIQSAVAAVAYFVSRAPVPLLLTLITFVFALLPAIGGAVVVVAVGVVQVLSGHLVSGLFLLAWGLVVVGLVDNFTRPYLLKGGMELNGGIVFFALLGGLAAFGAVGLIVGPLVVTFLISVLSLYRSDFEERQRSA